MPPAQNPQWIECYTGATSGLKGCTRGKLKQPQQSKEPLIKYGNTKSEVP